MPHVYTEEAELPVLTRPLSERWGTAGQSCSEPGGMSLPPRLHSASLLFTIL